MIWECAECGAHVARDQSPAVCDECGRAGTDFARLRGPAELSPDGESLRDRWLQAGVERAAFRACADVAWAT